MVWFRWNGETTRRKSLGLEQRSTLSLCTWKKCFSRISARSSLTRWREVMAARKATFQERNRRWQQWRGSKGVSMSLVRTILRFHDGAGRVRGGIILLRPSMNALITGILKREICSYSVGKQPHRLDGAEQKWKPVHKFVDATATSQCLVL